LTDPAVKYQAFMQLRLDCDYASWISFILVASWWSSKGCYALIVVMHHACYLPSLRPGGIPRAALDAHPVQLFIKAVRSYVQVCVTSLQLPRDA
jgi:hypothetical protein